MYEYLIIGISSTIEEPDMAWEFMKSLKWKQKIIVQGGKKMRKSARWIIMELVVAIFISGLFFTTEIRAEELYASTQENALKLYFAQREQEFLENNVALMGLQLDTSKTQRYNYIEGWKKDLNISVIDASIEYSILEVV